MLSALPLLAVALLSPSTQAPEFALKNGDRVVFYGDSITDNSPYTQLIEMFVTCRYPRMDVNFMNAGVGGDRVTGGWLGPIDERLTRDLISRRPNVVTIMLGMNDASYRPFDPKIFETYRNGYAHILDRLKKEAPNARVYLIQPSPFDDFTRPPTFEGGYNAVLVKYGDAIAEMALANRYGIIDLNTPVAAMLKKAATLDAPLSQKIIPDRVHPGGSGHLLMMAEILKAWRASPVVSKTTIDWTTGKAQTENATLSDWRGGRFTLLENSLPMPIDRANAEIALVLRSSDVEETLNQQMLTVSNMPAGSYGLKIDGTFVATFTHEQLAKGVNLAVLNTPMVQQAWKVVDMTMKVISVRFNRWRNFEHGIDGTPQKERDAAIESIMRLEQRIVIERKKLAQPVPHVFELVKTQ